jgi:hypothetical protein
MIFGVLYGASTIVLYQLLGMFGLPTFYDKLLQVPLLNLMVRRLDAWAERIAFAPPKPAFAAAWAAAFAALSMWGGLNDHHPGQFLPFWRAACQQGRAYACPYLADLDLTYCGRGSAYACNEAGLMHVALARSGEDARRLTLSDAAEPFERGCQLGLAAACDNLRVLPGPRRSPCPPTGPSCFNRARLPSPIGIQGLCGRSPAGRVGQALAPEP